MRPKDRMLRVVIVAAVGILAVPVLVAAQLQDYDDLCFTGEGGGSDRWQVEAVWIGTVNCTTLTSDPDGKCTAVQYTVDSNPDGSGNKNISHAAVLVYNPPPYPMIYANWTSSGSNSVYDRCVGDSATNTGIGSCHEQVVRVNANGDKTATWWVAVDGVRQQSKTTVAIKGQSEGRCTILGVGDEVDDNVLPYGCVPSCGNFNPDQTLTKTEKLNFHGCEVVFEFDLNTGEVVDAYLTQESVDNECDFDEGSVAELELRVDNVSFGFGKFGDGMISTGGDTCGCRMIGGRWWCWGKPCPD